MCSGCFHAYPWPPCRCKKLPKKLREWEAYNDLKKVIEDTQTVLPLLQELSKSSMRPRHWEQISQIAGKELNVHDPEFRLADMLSAGLVTHQVDIEEICDGADKQLAIGKYLCPSILLMPCLNGLRY